MGDSVSAGELYCEVETDKATMGWEAQEDGFIAQILLPSGAKDITVGAPVIVMVDEKESVAAFASYTAADAVPGAKPAATPTAPAAPAAVAAPKASPAAAAPSRAGVVAPSGSRVKASPYAKKLAEQAGISLSGIAGTGPDGRIVAEDVQKAIASGSVGVEGKCGEKSDNGLHPPDDP